MSEEKHNSEGKQISGGTIKKIFQNPDVLKRVIVGLVGFAVIILVFGIGVKIGALKAGYSYRWAENYHKNFGGPKGGFMDDWRKFPAEDFISGHGAFGEIIKIEDNDLVIAAKGRENVEKIIVMNQDTAITRGRETIKASELKVGDYATIIGSPNKEGQIEAKLIRVFSEDRPARLPYKLPSRPMPFF